MRCNKFLVLILAIAIVALLGSPLLAGAGDNAEGSRKVINRVNPVYPDLARRVNASGSVKLEVQIAPNGEVKSVKAIGGHPLLIGASQDAIKKWKFEPASETTTTIIEFRFNQGSNQ